MPSTRWCTSRTRAGTPGCSTQRSAGSLMLLVGGPFQRCLGMPVSHLVGSLARGDVSLAKHVLSCLPQRVPLRFHPHVPSGAAHRYGLHKSWLCLCCGPYLPRCNQLRRSSLFLDGMLTSLTHLVTAAVPQLSAEECGAPALAADVLQVRHMLAAKMHGASPGGQICREIHLSIRSI